MKKYIVDGSLRWYEPGTEPANAIPVGKKKAVEKPIEKVEPVEPAEPVEAPVVETKAKKKPANKARKAGANK